jgi:hypothetical protein
MAKAVKKSKPSKVKKKAKPKTAAEPIPAKQLRSEAPPGLVKGLQRLEHEARTYHAKTATVSDDDRRLLDRQVAIRDRLVAPPWMKRQQHSAQPQVRFARELIEITYPKGEWRTMRTGAIRHGCAPEATAQRKRLPSRDSFARATGRRS